VAPADGLAAFLDAARAAIEPALERYLPNAPDCPAIVADAMRYSLFAGGKRLRPVLTLAAADAVARRNPEGKRHLQQDAAQGFLGAEALAKAAGPAVLLALPAACAIEMIHTYSLIHDDLPAMDDDTLRRGRPTLHVKYGDGIAILAGDGLQAAAFALLAREPDTGDPAIASRKLRVVSLVGDAAGPIGMVGGQALDLQAAGQGPQPAAAMDANGLRDMHARKTGAIIRASAMSGAILAGADAAAVAAVARYGEHIGLAFQIVDDILDVEGDAATLGKSAGKDAAGDKPTYPALLGMERSRALAADCLSNARQALADAGLTEGHLDSIAEWVISRKA
jgi:geranylgeranyl pyrophosphate synthase